jgi:hypothetical protein
MHLIQQWNHELIFVKTEDDQLQFVNGHLHLLNQDFPSENLRFVYDSLIPISKTFKQNRRIKYDVHVF